VAQTKRGHMPTLTWKDDRLPADDVAPWDTTLLFVGATTPLSELISSSVTWSNNNASAKNLMIYCHGSSGYLHICREGIQLKDVPKLAPLSPFFDTVSIHACEVAKGNAGRAFCTKMAQVLAAPVAAAVGLQTNTGMQTIWGQIDDEKYDGDYFVHDPSGARSAAQRSR
jgi:hypothetical protein